MVSRTDRHLIWTSVLIKFTKGSVHGGRRYRTAHPLRPRKAGNSRLSNTDHRVRLLFNSHILALSLKGATSIVAIHGIGAYAGDTWCKNVSRDPNSPRYVNWLQDPDMLPSVAPNARVLRYGYESGWFGDNAIRQKASTVADRLLLALRRDREVYAQSQSELQ